MLSGFLLASAKGRSQNVTLSLKNATIEKAFTEIQRQTGYEFLYSPKLIKEAKPVDINVKNIGIVEALRLCFKNQPFGFTVIDKTVVIKPRKVEMGKEGQASPKKAAPIIITGKTLDENGKPLAGATIKIKGTNFVTVSDQLGNFTLPIPDNTSNILVFSYIGFQVQEYVAKASETIAIVMVRKMSPMNEVVVVGYGTQKKKDILGSVSTITSKDIASSPTTTSMFEILNGRLAGLNVINKSGQPGKYQYDLITRGNSNGLNPPTLSAGQGGAPTSPFNNTLLNNLNFGNSMPYILIDGIEGDMNLLNPQDIESVTLLKDASAAIYGVRAANGVLLVTTKKGIKGKVIIDYQYFAGLQGIQRRPTFLPSWQQAVLINEVIDNEGIINGAGSGGGGSIIGGGINGGSVGPLRPLHKFTDEEIQKYKDGTDPNYPNTDWMGLVYQKPGLQQQHTLNFSGGDDNTLYRMSFEYLNQNGNIEGINSKRYGARINLKSTPFKTLKIETGLNFSHAPAQEPGGSSGFLGDILGGAYTISPMVPLKYQNGAYSTTSQINPIAWLHAGSFYKASSSTMNGNLGLTWTPIEDLVIKPSFGFNYNINNYQVFAARLNSYFDGPAGSPLVVNTWRSQLINRYTENTSSGLGINPQITASYQKVKGDHLFGILVGASESSGNSNNIFAQKKNLLNNSLQSLDLASADGQVLMGSRSQVIQQSAFGRVFYNYGDRYYIEHTLRGDASTTFNSDKRWGIFPSFAAGWLISNESFFQHSTSLLKTINFLKLKASWSRLGNNSIGNFAYLTRLGVSNYSFNNQLQSSLEPMLPGNSDIRWEQTTIKNIGLDAVMFNNKLTVTVDAYNKTTNDILLTIGGPANYGYPTAPAENKGSMWNKGVEIAISYQDRVGEFGWSAKGVFSYNKNKITNFIYKTPAKEFGQLRQNIEGYSYGALFGLQAEGIYQNQDEVSKSATLNDKVGPGDIRYKDQNGDGKITTDDIVYLGNSIPTTTLGLALGGTWKGFELNLFFTGSAGRKASVGSALGSIGDYDNKATPAFWDRWTPSNPTDKFPRAWAYNMQNNPQQYASSFWVKDASYVRLQNITLGYSFHPKFFGKEVVKGVRVFYSASNLFTYSPNFWKWLDPQTTQVEASVLNYPSPTMHALGVNVQF